MVLILKICNFHLIWHQILGKVTKFRLCSFITSKVIGKKPRAWWKTPPPPPPSPYKVKNEALKPSCHKENTSERESFQSLQSLAAQEAEGLEGLLNLPFFEDSTKRTGF